MTLLGVFEGSISPGAKVKWAPPHKYLLDGALQNINATGLQKALLAHELEDVDVRSISRRGSSKEV